jgi:hypothetical protein
MSAGDSGVWDRMVTNECGHPVTVRWLRDAYLAELRRSAALMVDGDRRERRAAEAALSCDEHGREIRYLRHMASLCWDDAQRAEEARQGIVRALIVAAQNLEGRTEPVPAEVVARVLLKAVDGQDKALKRPRSPYAACLHGDGGCGHDGLSDSLKAALAAAPGQATQGALFGEPQP